MRILGLSPDITDVNETESIFSTDGLGFAEGFDGSRFAFPVSVVGVEPADMPGDIRAHLGDKGGYLSQLFIRVVLTGNDKSRDLYTHAKPFHQPDRLQYGFEPGSAHRPVEFFAE